MPSYPTYKLSEIARSTKGKKPKSVSKEKTDGFEIPYVDIKAFEKRIVDNYTDGENCTFCKPDDVLIVWDGARCGFVGRGVEGAIGSTLAKISSDKYTNDFLFYFLQSKYKVLNSNPRGVGIPHIEPNLLWNFEIPDVDKTTQRAIVSRIETLFAELDKAVQHLRTAQQQIKTYRQAVLNHWLNNEDGKWGKKTAEECVVNENYSLAIGPFGSDLKVEDYTESGVKLVFVRDITSNFEDKKNKFVSEYKADQLKAHNVFKGDLLITKMGDPPGQTGIFPYDRGVITSDVLRMKTNDKILNKYYAMYYILSSEGGKQIKEMTQGVAQKKISLGRFKKFLFPIPSIPEQQRIVNEIESRLSQATASETCIENALQQAEALRQSILKKAFSGELI